ncbi:AraC family transcriptional regulator [Sulfurimonas sp.]
MKKTTLQIHTKIANDIMYYIYKYIDTDINIDELSQSFGLSKFHMHRIFKKEFKKNIYESIKSIRLQKASSLLLTNPYTTISEIANSCGYSSHTSFIKAFKARFRVTPSTWRNTEYRKFTNKAQTHLYENINIKIVKMPEIHLHYIRHLGYNKEIKKVWQKLQTWVFSNDIQDYKYIALYHDNPTVTPLNKCHYVACVETHHKLKNSSLPMLSIPKGVYAKFDFSGAYGDILKFMNWIYFEWLIENAYETTTNPAYTIYHKNHFLEDDGKFEISYYLPIKL